MHARERIIRARFAEHACAHCGSHYLSDSVVVLARRRSTWMVMASCPECERRALFVVSFPDSALPNVDPLSFDQPQVFPSSFLTFPDPDEPPSSAVLSPPTPPLPEASSPITQADINAMHDFLTSFTGDFRALFSGRGGVRPEDHSAS